MHSQTCWFVDEVVEVVGVEAEVTLVSPVSPTTGPADRPRRCGTAAPPTEEGLRGDVGPIVLINEVRRLAAPRRCWVLAPAI